MHIHKPFLGSGYFGTIHCHARLAGFMRSYIRIMLIVKYVNDIAILNVWDTDHHLVHKIRLMKQLCSVVVHSNTTSLHMRSIQIDSIIIILLLRYTCILQSGENIDSSRTKGYSSALHIMKPYRHAKFKVCGCYVYLVLLLQPDYVEEERKQRQLMKIIFHIYYIVFH